MLIWREICAASVLAYQRPATTHRVRPFPAARSARYCQQNTKRRAPEGAPGRKRRVARYLCYVILHASLFSFAYAREVQRYRSRKRDVQLYMLFMFALRC